MARDIHNAIIPIDFSDPKDVLRIVETVTDFVKRKIPIRFGLVPLTNTDGATQQAKVLYHILDTYGISGLIEYLEYVSSCIISNLDYCLTFLVSLCQENRDGQ